MEYRKAEWEHYEDLPFEIVVETVDPETGAVTHRELVGRSNHVGEAERRRRASASAIVNSDTHRAVLEIVRKLGKAAEA